MLLRTSGVSTEFLPPAPVMNFAQVVSSKDHQRRLRERQAAEAATAEVGHHHSILQGSWPQETYLCPPCSRTTAAAETTAGHLLKMHELQNKPDRHRRGGRRLRRRRSSGRRSCVGRLRREFKLLKIASRTSRRSGCTKITSGTSGARSGRLLPPPPCSARWALRPPGRPHNPCQLFFSAMHPLVDGTCQSLISRVRPCSQRQETNLGQQWLAARFTRGARLMGAVSCGCAAVPCHLISTSDSAGVRCLFSDSSVAGHHLVTGVAHAARGGRSGAAAAGGAGAGKGGTCRRHRSAARGADAADQGYPEGAASAAGAAPSGSPDCTSPQPALHHRRTTTKQTQCVVVGCRLSHAAERDFELTFGCSRESKATQSFTASVLSLGAGGVREDAGHWTVRSATGAALRAVGAAATAATAVSKHTGWQGPPRCAVGAADAEHS